MARAADAPFNRYDLLKVVALTAMTIDHTAAFLLTDAEWMRAIGRIAAPLFLFLTGYSTRFDFRSGLLVAAIGVTLADALLLGRVLPLNILWSILFARFVAGWVVRRAVTPWLVVLACALWFLPLSYALDYSTLVLVWMLFGYAMRTAPRGRDAMAYGAIGLIGAIGHAVLFMQWTLPLYGMAAVLLVATWLVLWRFAAQPMRWNPPVLRFLSRKSLEYYVAHRVMLVALKTAA